MNMNADILDSAPDLKLNKDAFYQADVIKKLLLCPNCDQRYENPLNLPCSHNVCTNCYKSLKLDASETFECPMCHIDNPIPKDKGFPINYLITELLDLEPVEVKRGKNFEKLIESTSRVLEDLNKLIAELNDYFNESGDRIKNICSNLREQVNLSANTKIEQLNEHRNFFLEQINNYQHKCIENFERNLKQERKELIDKSLLDVDEWKANINMPTCDENEIENIKVMAENLLDKIKEESKNYDSVLFDKEIWRFIRNEHVLLPDSIGKIEVESFQKEELFEEGYGTFNESEIYSHISH